MTQRVDKIKEEFKKVSAKGGYPNEEKIPQQKAIEFMIAASYTIGFEEGYEAAKQDFVANFTRLNG